MQRPANPLISLWAAIALASAAAAGCTTAAPQPSQSQPGSSSEHATPTASATPVSCQGGWRTTRLAVARQVSVPPVPVATAIRTGSHSGCRFDRIAIDIRGALPGYTVAFVRKVIQDASGKTISVPGTRYLLIRLRPAQGHSPSGATTLSPRSRLLGYPMLKGYAVAGDFEGVLTIALGLSGGTRFRVGEFTGRLYVDIAW